MKQDIQHFNTSVYLMQATWNGSVLICSVLISGVVSSVLFIEVFSIQGVLIKGVPINCSPRHSISHLVDDATE